ncbi:MAG: radical SAM protein, partial [Lentisphaerae bacterium]|nr:radical SAM protein [Lentisphaerota bacterium]
MGRETPLHFLRFFPHYQMRHLPPTPAATMDRARQIALASGLHYVYIGNLLVEDAQSTLCPSCHKLLIRRVGHTVTQNTLAAGRCSTCQTEIYGIWN